MTNRTILILLLIFISYNSFAQIKQKNWYQAIYSTGQPDYSNHHTRTLFAHAISDKNNSISEVMIGDIVSIGKFNLQGYGQADIIKIEMKNPPSVLQDNFLVLIDHVHKKISSINVDLYYLIRSNLKDDSKIIMVLNNVNGGIDLSTVTFKYSVATLTHPQRLYTNNDCKKFKSNSFRLSNVDIDHDGWMDVLIKFKELDYCDKDGNDRDHPISSNEIIKKLIYKRATGNWQLH